MAKEKKIFREAIKKLDGLFCDLTIPYDHHRQIMLDQENVLLVIQAKKLIYEAKCILNRIR